MTPVRAWFRYASYVMAGLFALSAVLQYNDPDAVRWILIYGAGAVIAAVVPSDRRAAIAAVLLALGCLAWVAYLVHLTWGQIEVSDLTRKMSEKGGAVEVGREAGGLGIMAAWLVFAAAYRWPRRR